MSRTVGKSPTALPQNLPAEYADWLDTTKVLYLERRLAQLIRQREHQEILADNQRHLLKAMQRDREAALSQLRDKHDQLERVHLELTAAKDHLEEEVLARTRELEEKNARLEEHAQELEQINTTLDVLIKKNNQDCETLTKAILKQQHSVVAPLINRLFVLIREPEQQALLQQIQASLQITDTDQTNQSGQCGSICSGLTSRELEVARYVARGKTCREIAAILEINARYVEACCYSIRKKNNLSRSVNLKAYLAAMGILRGE